MRYNKTERIGVNAIEKIFLEELNWIFRDQPLVDVGIDAIIEIVENNDPTGKLIGSQIKTGKGSFHNSDNKLTYYASDIHYNYWNGMNLPVILIGYIPEEKEAYWVEIKHDNFIRTKRQWKIDIFKKQKLNSYSESRLKALVGFKNEVILEDIFTTERIDFLLEETKNISKSSIRLHEIAEFMAHIQKHSEINGNKLNELVKLNVGDRDYRVVSALNDIAKIVSSTTPKMEKSIAEFSTLFARGYSAFNYLVLDCKNLEQYETLEFVILNIQNVPEIVDTTISKIEKLKALTESFSKRHKLLKQNTLILSEVLGQIMREFKVASEETKKIIIEIESIL